MSDRAQRRLAAIVAADVAGYSRLVGADEEGTLAALRAHRTELIDPLLAQHGGRIANTAGDSLLLEFPSAVDALRCARSVQAAMAERNMDVEPERRIEFRVGINVGDVVSDGDDLLGNGVNVAARLEGLAEPGGIVLSRAARDQVRDQIDLRLEDLGEVEVKNIARPVRAFRVLRDGESDDQPVTPPRRWPRYAAFVGLLALLAGGGAYWWSELRPDGEPAARAKYAYALPDRPSIAVLPFDNISGDAEQDYFADGMTEDLITDLSKISGLFVIARNSSFAYKGKAVDVKQVGRELGVRYVLEGSVRRAGERLRINAQLIDAVSGGHLWSERYDGALADVFALQDRINARIVEALTLSLIPAESQRIAAVETDSPVAYDAFQRGWALYRLLNPTAFAQAIPFFEKAIALDQNYGRAHAALASIYWEGGNDREWHKAIGVKGRAEARNKVRALLRRIGDKPIALAHVVRAEIERNANFDHDAAKREARLAIELEPGLPDAHSSLAWSLALTGETQAAIEAAKTAMRIDPLYPFFNLVIIGFTHFIDGDYPRAIADVEVSFRQNPANLFTGVLLAALYGLTDQQDKAAKAIADVNVERAKLGLGPIAATYAYLVPFKETADRERFLAGLRQAGMEVPRSDNRDPELGRVLNADEIKALIVPARTKGKLVFLSGRTVPFTFDIYSGTEAAWSDEGTSPVPIEIRFEGDRLCHRWGCGTYYELTPAAATEWQATHVDVEDNGNRLYFTHIERIEAAKN